MSKTIIWFRQDLRLTDNPALHEAASGAILPLYINDTENAARPLGGASQVWLHHSLGKLNKSLNEHLLIRSGDPLTIIESLVKKLGIERICWNRCYEPWQIARDKKIKKMLQEQGVEVVSCNGSLLWEPWQIKKSDQTHYRVFTPFYKACLKEENKLRSILPRPKRLTYLKHDQPLQTIESLDLLPKKDWHEKIIRYWDTGEKAALDRLDEFLDNDVDHYEKARDFPALQATSRLAPHLHWGEISPMQAWYAAESCGRNAAGFIRELYWREFSYYILYHHPTLPKKNLQPKFDDFPWRKNKKYFDAWKTGKTGYPIVDAGMRELWETGYMHNRVRMITASFLVKNLQIHWREGESWFWDCLMDADLANNCSGWQWVAGCGVDAAPFFRIFNPVTQSQKFDPKGEYIRRYLPELAQLSDKEIHEPWKATAEVDYPEPIVDLKQSREIALSLYKKL